ncbi:MAG: EAL domain-containing protein [Eubacteriales bacterium]
MDLPTPATPESRNVVDNQNRPADNLTEEVFRRIAEQQKETNDRSEDLDFTVEGLLERVQELEEELTLHQIDSLTNVMTNSAFFAKVESILGAPENQEKTFLIWQFDIDKFQSINNLYSVEEGNRLLLHCATYLKSLIPHSPSTAIGRIGGDVFCCILPFVSQNSDSDYESVARAWITGRGNNGGFEDFLRSFRDDYRFNVSIGFYVIEDTSEPIEIIHSRVLLATKSCKQDSERSYAFYDKAMTLEVANKQMITSEMHKALENGEFAVYLQPKVRLSDLSLVGCEALVRWIHPKKGRIPPDDFIPLFEENGFITSMDLYVLRRCCNYLQSWFRQGLTPIPISVNLSQRDLLTPNLAEKLINILDQYDVPVRYIHLEITESAYAADEEGALNVTSELKNCGFHLEMDDFGKGYSSLNMIAQLPIDTLKLDMKFLEGDSANSGQVISFVTSLASHMDLVTVAEGIETQEQLEFLQSIRTDCGQGYLFSRPLEKADFDAYMRGCSIATPRKARTDEHSKSAKKQALTTSELWSATSHFSQVFNSFTLGIGVCELNLITGKFRLVRSNPYFAESLGVTQDELKVLGEDLFAMIHHEDIGKIMVAVRKVTDPKRWSVDTPVFSEDIRLGINPAEGDSHWVHVKGKFVDFSTDTRTYVVTAVDVDYHYSTLDGIHNQLNEVDALKRQMKIYHAMGLSGTATVYYPEGQPPQVIEANDTFLELHSYPKPAEGAAVPFPLQDLISDESGKMIWEKLEKAIQFGEKSLQWDLYITDHMGIERNTITNGVIRHEEDGLYTDVIISVLQNEAKLNTQLSNQLELAEMIVKNADITRLDLKTGSVTYGRDLQDAFGFPPVANSNPDGSLPNMEQYSPETITKVGKMIQEIIATKKAQEISLLFRDQGDAEYSPRIATFFPELNKEGEVIAVSGVGKPLPIEQGGHETATFSKIINGFADGVIVLNPVDHSLIYANKRFYEIVGITREALRADYDNIPFNLVLAFDENNEELDVSHMDDAISKGGTVVLEARLRNHPLRWIAYHGRLEGGYFYINCFDVTEKKAMEAQLARVMEFSDVLHTISDELLFQADIKKSTVTFSGYRAVSFGLAGQEITLYPGCAIRGIIAQEYVSTYLAMVEDMKEGREVVHTLQLRDLQGETGWYRFEYRIIREDNEPAFAVGKGSNISKEMSILSEIERDSVTKMLTENSMKICVNQVLSSTVADIITFDDPSVSHTHALVRITLTNYENLQKSMIEQTLGQHLADMATTIEQIFRETDYVAREGNTFVVFLHSVGTRALAEQKVHLIYQNIDNFNREDPTLPDFEVEIGVTYSPLKGTTYQTLVQNFNEVPRKTN